MPISPNITRFSYSFASFQGWRLSVRRHTHKFVHYFADKKYGGSVPALQAAEKARKQLFALMRQHGNDHGAAFSACRSLLLPNSYPQGLRPLKTKSDIVQKAKKRRSRTAEPAPTDEQT